MLRRRFALALVLLLGPPGCAKPDSVELGGACTQPVECKDPADACVKVMGEALCTMACSATDPCPEDYSCARMDIQVKGSGDEATAAAGVQGRCLASARLGPQVATIKPKGAGKKAKKRKNKKKRRKKAAAEDEAGKAPSP